MDMFASWGVKVAAVEGVVTEEEEKRAPRVLRRLRSGENTIASSATATATRRVVKMLEDGLVGEPSGCVGAGLADGMVVLAPAWVSDVPLWGESLEIPWDLGATGFIQLRTSQAGDARVGPGWGVVW